jgi:hypothetical protein
MVLPRVLTVAEISAPGGIVVAGQDIVGGSGQNQSLTFIFRNPWRTNTRA